jgi:hypothetical protein
MSAEFLQLSVGFLHVSGDFVLVPARFPAVSDESTSVRAFQIRNSTFAIRTS